MKSRTVRSCIGVFQLLGRVHHAHLELLVSLPLSSLLNLGILRLYILHLSVDLLAAKFVEYGWLLSALLNRAHVVPEQTVAVNELGLCFLLCLVDAMSLLTGVVAGVGRRYWSLKALDNWDSSACV
jgi:hypothetical protein